MASQLHIDVLTFNVDDDTNGIDTTYHISLATNADGGYDGGTNTTPLTVILGVNNIVFIYDFNFDTTLVA